jgi:hypothetical protein
MQPEGHARIGHPPDPSIAKPDPSPTVAPRPRHPHNAGMSAAAPQKRLYIKTYG